MIYPTVECTFIDFLFIFEREGGDHQGIYPDRSKLSLIRRLALDHLGPMRMQDIRTPHIDRMMKHLRRQGCTAQILNRLRMALRQVFELALIFGIAWDNPCDEVVRYSVEQPMIRMYSEDETERIISAVDHMPNSGVFNTMMMTGASMRQVLGLSTDRIDFDRHRLMFSQWEENRESYIVEMPDALESVILREMRLQDRRRAVRYGMWSNPERRLFTDGYGCRLHVNAVRNQYNSLRKLSRVPDLCMRTMRSNYIMTSLIEGGQIPEAARQAGYRNISSIMPYYYEAERIIHRRKAQ